MKGQRGLKMNDYENNCSKIEKALLAVGFEKRHEYYSQGVQSEVFEKKGFAVTLQFGEKQDVFGE